MEKTQRIQVVVRKRPLSRKEIEKSDQDIVTGKPPNAIILKEAKVKVDLTKYTEEHTFMFDHVYDENVNNRQLYTHSVKPLVMASLEGVKITCFAYGQTGSGKTFTMMGDNNSQPGLFLYFLYQS